ncbi:MAG: YaeQ family protein [Myxococcales bacterium]|nr:YaeQ family protein [Myxococcales bacterium]
MAIGATIYRFHIELSDVDNGVFEQLDLRVAKHPSESTRFLVVRVLARCLEHIEGIEFTRGVSDTELPALIVRDLQGGISTWIEVGVPAPKRVHKATSRADKVLVYAHKQVDHLIAALKQAELRRADRVTVVHFDDALLEGLEDALSRAATWSVTLSDGTLYVEADGQSVVGQRHRQSLG